MGNRAVIASADEKEKGVGIYVHWNGGIESIEAFLAYCEMKGFREPTDDNYGWAYLATVIGNYFGDGLSVGVDLCDHLDTDNGDNGVYYIDGWKVVGRSYDGPLATNKGQLYDGLVEINNAQSPAIKVSMGVIQKFCNEHNIPIPIEG